MKRHLLLIIILFSIAATAQERNHQQRPPRMSHEEFRIKQQEYITNHAELTEEEISAFFPLYFELQDKKHEANRRVWTQARAIAPHERTEEEYAQMIEALADIKIQCATLEKEYLKKFKEILPAKKIMRVQMAEDRFQRELLREMQQGDKRQRGPR